LWPDRSQASDGICASPKHTAASPSSDHEPHVVYQGKGYATAVDLTDDKANGCDADAWADWLVATRDSRVKYLIRNREMASSYATSRYPAWTWRPYTGANPHSTHTHLSIKPEALFDDGPWFPQLITTPPKPGEAELTADEREAVLTANHFVKVVWPQYAAKIDQIHQHLEVLMKGATLGNGAVIPPVPRVIFDLAEKHGIDV
jgi:hypothetical protein